MRAGAMTRPGSEALLTVLIVAAAVCDPACDRSRGVDPPGIRATREATRRSAGGDRVVLDVRGGKLMLETCGASIVRVAYARSADFFGRRTLAAGQRQCDATRWTRSDGAGVTTLSTPSLKAVVDLSTGAVAFQDPGGRPILAEKAAGGRTLTPATVLGERTSHVRQQWAGSDGEALYGLGQHQQSLMNIKGYDLDLRQYNSEVFIPFLVSSRGYGILWDNTSFSRFGDLRDPAPIPGVTYDARDNVFGAAGGHVDWQGEVEAPVTGDYQLFTYASGGLALDLDGRRLIDHWRQGWLPNTEVVKVRLQAGRSYPLRVQWQSDIGVNLLKVGWKPPQLPAGAQPATSLWSEVGDGIDYYFVYGPELDDVVAGYRRLTGQAAMLPRWAFGFWQCREHYQSAEEITDVLDGYRARRAPLDSIVQDWRYWTDTSWGSHELDRARYPDPRGLVASIHDTYHARFMISVWPKFYTTTANYAALAAGGFVYRPNVTEGKVDFLGHHFTFYDAFNPAARALYWSQIRDRLFVLGVDAWWLDASEPEIVEGDQTATGGGPFSSPAAQVQTNSTHMNPTALGSGARVHNAYALVNSQAVYEGQRAAAPDQRVFILTRNGFAGQQRYGAVTWSGDITSTWSAMRKQIPAGLGFSVSGMPYWTLDSGGFSVPQRFVTPTDADLAEWRELNTRWFEYATFLPVMRVHGQAPLREIWEFGGDGSPAYQAMLKFDRLRYRLLPYIYAVAGAVTHDGGTMMRPLVMDFRDDATARDSADQYMFGPAFLISPVTAYQATSRQVYLPPAAGWYDFWTGARADGAQSITAPAPFDAPPVHVRAGAIVPAGPDLQYSDEKPADPITLWIYAGADGAFSLYEDGGVTYDYEQGDFSRILLSWNDAARTLTIGARQGAFPGMLLDRTFQVVLVAPDKPAGFSFAPAPDAVVTYGGDAVDVRL